MAIIKEVRSIMSYTSPTLHYFGFLTVNKLRIIYSTAGARGRTGFTSSRIRERKNDLLQALKLLDDIEEQKKRTRDMCALFLAKLPRELRDIVYSHIVPGPSVKVCPMAYPVCSSSVGTESIVCLPSEYSARCHMFGMSEKTIPLPYQPDDTVLGKVVSGELAEYFHRHTRFDFGFIYAPLFTEYIYKKLFIHSIRTASVDVSCHLATPDEMPDAEQRTEYHDRQMVGLDGLADQAINNIDLTIFASSSSYHRPKVAKSQVQSFREILELVFPRLIRLEKAGYKTSLVLDPHTGIRLAGSREPEYPYVAVEEVVFKDKYDLVFSSENTEFSINGYVNKLIEVSIRMAYRKTSADHSSLPKPSTKGQVSSRASRARHRYHNLMSV